MRFSCRQRLRTRQHYEHGRLINQTFSSKQLTWYIKQKRRQVPCKPSLVTVVSQLKLQMPTSLTLLLNLKIHIIEDFNLNCVQKYFPLHKETFPPSLLSFLHKNKNKKPCFKRSLTEEIHESYTVGFQGNLDKSLGAESFAQTNF